MNWWDERAANVQRMTRVDEANEVQQYEDNEVKQAVVHGRQDIVLMVGQLSSINKQLSRTNALLVLLLIALLIGLGLRSI